MSKFDRSILSMPALAMVVLCCVGTGGALRAADSSNLASAVMRGSLRGVLVPVANVQLSARAPGVIEKFGAEEGQQVREGDLLVQLNADIELAELGRAKAVRETSISEVERTKRDLDRTTALFTNEKIGSQKEMEDAQSAYQIAAGRKKQADAEVALAEARLKERSINATISGLLFRRTHAIGEAVERLEPVIRLIDTSKLEFVIYGGADLLGRFKNGQITRIVVESGPARGTTINGTVSYVDPTMDPETSTFRVKIAVEPSDKIQSGISVTLQLPSEVN
jgi:RND family efflux transporter MFP subunit